MKSSLLWLVPLVCSGTFASCGKHSTAAPSSSSFSLSLTAPKGGWAESIECQTGADGIRNLTLDGVCFELRDPAAYLLDWKALGMSGIKMSSSFSYDSTKAVEGAFLAVAGKSVEIRDGDLTWGETVVGPVAAGDVVVVDADGLRIQDRGE